MIQWRLLLVLVGIVAQDETKRNYFSFRQSLRNKPLKRSFPFTEDERPRVDPADLVERFRTENVDLAVDIHPRNLSTLGLFFGNFVADEILDTKNVGCPVKMVQNVSFPIMDPKMGFDEGGRGSVINSATPWIDGSAIYGPSIEHESRLRSWNGGKLKVCQADNGCRSENPTEDRNDLMISGPTVREKAKPFLIGNLYANTNPFLLSISIIWHKWHNVVAERIQRADPSASDEIIFQRARSRVVAQLQSVLFYEWLPRFLPLANLTAAAQFNGTMPPYIDGVDNTGFDQFTDPQLTVEFALALRSMHSMLPNGIILRQQGEEAGDDCIGIDCCRWGSEAFRNVLGTGEQRLRLCQIINDLQDEIREHSVADIVRGMASQTSRGMSSKYNADLLESAALSYHYPNGNMFQIDLERSKTYAATAFDEVQARFSIPVFDSLKLQRLFPDGFHPDFLAAGLVESETAGGDFGATFATVVLDQFLRIRQADWNWFENFELNQLLSGEEVRQISNTTFRDVILAVTDIPPFDIQEDIFTTGGAICFFDYRDQEFATECPSVFTTEKFSEVAFGLSVAAVFTLPAIIYGLMILLTQNNSSKTKRRTSTVFMKPSKSEIHRTSDLQKAAFDNPMFTRSYNVVEVESGENSEDNFIDQNVTLILEQEKIHIITSFGESEVIHFAPFPKLICYVSNNKKREMFHMEIPKRKDLVVRFLNNSQRSEFVELLEEKTEVNKQDISVSALGEAEILEFAMTASKRKTAIEKFIKCAFRQSVTPDKDEDQIPSIEEVLNCDHGDMALSKNELATLFGQRSESTLMKRVFEVIDIDRDNTICAQEFVEFLILLMKGNGKRKAELIFKIYDVGTNTKLSVENVAEIVELMQSRRKNYRDVERGIDIFMSEIGIREEARREERDFFHLVLSSYKYSDDKKDQKAKELETGRRFTRYRIRKYTLDTPSTGLQKILPRRVKRVFEQQRRELGFLFVFVGVTVAFMADRFYFFLFLNETGGFRQITEIGLLMSRTTAAGMSFIYPLLLLSMSRNLLTVLRQKYINQFIPFDRSVDFHKLAAKVAGVFAVVHTIGHVINFRNISLQPKEVVSCILPSIASNNGLNDKPTFVQYLFGTLQGSTGLALVVILLIMHTFAHPRSRKNRHKIFWRTHMLYPAFFIIIILHGIEGILQSPRFHLYLLIPGIIFIIDKTIEIRRSYVEVQVQDFEILQSSVTFIKMKRPKSFYYISGQYIRLACPTINGMEFHPFTMTSCPAEDFISVHIRAIGPWTISLRNLFKDVRNQLVPRPVMYVDGPLGEGHQNWRKYEIAVLCGAGIGVTPFASIIKDLSSRNAVHGKCKKVIFIWVKRRDKHFEWMTDIVRNAEKWNADLESHIFITENKSNFDLRTFMRYLLEMKLTSPVGRSLFTGLRASAHFGRPNFPQLFQKIQSENPSVGKIGVFSCGPPALSKSVDQATKKLNRDDHALFEHYFENF